MTAVVRYLLTKAYWIPHVVWGLLSVFAMKYVLMTWDPSAYSTHGAVLVGSIIVVIHFAAQSWRVADYGVSDYAKDNDVQFERKITGKELTFRWAVGLVGVAIGTALIVFLA